MASDASTASASDTTWLVYAIASGACAAFNGALAKLTTNALTSSWAAAMARLLHIEDMNNRVDLAIRGMFFVCNLALNGVMWGLFTRALTLANSTVRVSVINTSANFVITALLGLVVFDEKLPGLWWIGAGLLVAGSVIIGRRDGQETSKISEPPEKKDSSSRATTERPLKQKGEDTPTTDVRKRIPAKLQDDW